MTVTDYGKLTLDSYVCQGQANKQVCYLMYVRVDLGDERKDSIKYRVCCGHLFYMLLFVLILAFIRMHK